MTQQEFFDRYKYSIRTDKVGGGAFGTVYKAFDKILNREVAIKVSEVKIMGGKEFSLKDEFDAIKDLPVHPNIANYEALFTFENQQGVFDHAIMQFYKEGNLSSFIKSNPSLAQKEQVALDLLEGIGHLHKHNVVHRDLKPGNILIVRHADTVIPVITDFGLSKQAELEGQSRFSNSFGGGTLKYSSPEQLKAEKLGLNTDLWAYGVIVHEIFTVKNLFMAQGITGASAEAEKEIYEQIIGIDISDMLNELPAKWKQVVEQCLVRDGSKRIKTVEAIKELINASVYPDQSKELIEDNTIISVAEELLDDQTIIETRSTNPIEESSQPIAKKEKENKAASNKKKIGFSAIVAIVIFSIVMVVFTFLSSDSKDWEMASKANSVEAYQLYLDSNIEGEYISEAEENISWLNTIKDGTLMGYYSFKNRYPNGQFTIQAQSTIESMVFDSVQKINTTGALEYYIKKYPNSDKLALVNELVNTIENSAKEQANKDKEEHVDKPLIARVKEIAWLEDSVKLNASITPTIHINGDGENQLVISNVTSSSKQLEIRNWSKTVNRPWETMGVYLQLHTQKEDVNKRVNYKVTINFENAETLVVPITTFITND